MANTIRIKRRKTGDSGPPDALKNAEVAYSEIDDVLYYGKGGTDDAASAIEPIAGKGAYLTIATEQTVSGGKTFAGPVALGSQASAATPASADNSTTVATTAFVKAQGYRVSNEQITLSGDATGTGTTALAVILAATGVTAGTYNDVATEVRPITVDAKGRVTGFGGAVTITPAWSSITGTPTTLAGYGITDAVLSSEKGAANGVATLDAGGKVPAGQLPSFVDDVLEYANLAGFPGTGETGKIYVAIDTGYTYRWSGSAYVQVGSNALTADEALKLTTARAISAAGDATWTVNFDGSADVSAALTLADSGVTAGTYNNSATAVRPFTVDAKGRVTAIGTAVTITPDWASLTGKPTTLGGYGITDAQPLDADLTAIAALAGTTGLLMKTAADTWALDTTDYLSSADVIDGGTF
jgi:hypothetical protein